VRHSGDAGKVNRLLGWKPSLTWEQGLKATIEWYRANRGWWEKQIWMRQIPIITAAGRKEYH
jgi:dTDP-glucose 4,6-dehydratase